MASKVHTIPIPRGWSPEQAWEAIRRGDKLPILPDEETRWASIECDEYGRLKRLLGEDDPEG